MAADAQTSGSVAIIGGGFSGTVTAIQLARLSGLSPLRILLIDPARKAGRGLAYRFEDDNLLLNVPAGNMSALAEDPNHFVRFCQRIDPSLSSGSFVSRRLYGHYLQDTLAETIAGCSARIETLIGEAVKLQRTRGSAGWHIGLASGQQWAADHVVLATGHQAPRFPIASGPDVSARVISAWDYSAMQRLANDQPVVILGTGHTAIDALFCLTQSQPSRQVVMLSRHGLLPHRHRPTPTPPQPQAFPDYLRSAPATVRGYTRALRQHLKLVALQGGDWRDALNALRPHTSQLWQSWPATEQGRFLRHMAARWDVHRHRLAPIAAQRLEALLSNGQVKVIAGRIHAIASCDTGVAVELQHRGTAEKQTLQAAAIVNCAGPDADVTRCATPLLAELLRAGLIQGDPHGLGLMVSPNHQPLDAQHMPVRGLWYVGPMLKARYWEATAVPELRVHALELAQSVLACVTDTVAEPTA